MFAILENNNSPEEYNLSNNINHGMDDAEVGKGINNHHSHLEAMTKVSKRSGRSVCGNPILGHSSLITLNNDITIRASGPTKLSPGLFVNSFCPALY